jgi:hypothetical protein
MLSLGWHPRHIAGLIRSKYERDYGWGGKWHRYDATSRADFYTRLFAGLFMTGQMISRILIVNLHRKKDIVLRMNVITNYINSGSLCRRGGLDDDWPIGLSTGCFYNTGIFDCLETILKAGFGMIEVCSFPAHLDYHNSDAVARAARMVRDIGLEAYSFHAPFADNIDITALDDQSRNHARDGFSGRPKPRQLWK